MRKGGEERLPYMCEMVYKWRQVYLPATPPSSWTIFVLCPKPIDIPEDISVIILFVSWKTGQTLFSKLLDGMVDIQTALSEKSGDAACFILYKGNTVLRAWPPHICAAEARKGNILPPYGKYSNTPKSHFSLKKILNKRVFFSSSLPF